MGWTWAAASCRGTSHERTGVRLQDAYSCFSPAGRQDVIAAFASDGAGSAACGGEGASLVCRTLSVKLRRHFVATTSLPGPSDFESWLDYTRDLLSTVASRRGLAPREFAATLVGVVSNGDESILVHVGDGCAVLMDAQSGEWFAPSWPDHGEYASTTYFVTDEGNARLRVTSIGHPISALAVFTDGLERLVLDMAIKKPSAKFFRGIIAPVAASTSVGREPSLSTALKNYLAGEFVINRTDDDKTLLLAVRK